jgi:hypothetical protein
MKFREGVNIYKITTEAKVKIHYYVRADSEDEATAKWEQMDGSCGSVDDESVEMEEYDSTTLVRPYEGSQMQQTDLRIEAVLAKRQEAEITE